MSVILCVCAGFDIFAKIFYIIWFTSKVEYLPSVNEAIMAAPKAVVSVILGTSTLIFRILDKMVNRL